MSIVSVSTQVFKPTAVLMPSRRLWELLYLMKKSQSFQLIIILNLQICDVHMHRNTQHMSVCEESCLKASRGCFCCKNIFFPTFSMAIIGFLSFPLEMEVVSGQTLRSVQHHNQHFRSSLSHPARTCPSLDRPLPQEYCSCLCHFSAD